MKRFLECCCTSPFEAVQAQEGGASRVELCEDLPSGGVMPRKEVLEETLKAVSIPVNVLVRPRRGGFVYTEDEILETLGLIRMCKDIRVAAPDGSTRRVNGVVVGALDGSLRVDKASIGRMVALARAGDHPLSVTFHRAFDECLDPLEALEDIIALGCDTLLTAGHAASVNEGKEMLRTLVRKAAGRIAVLAGSGVRPSNIAGLEKYTGVTLFHSSAHGPDGRTCSAVVSEMAGR